MFYLRLLGTFKYLHDLTRLFGDNINSTCPKAHLGVDFKKNISLVELLTKNSGSFVKTGNAQSFAKKNTTNLKMYILYVVHTYMYYKFYVVVNKNENLSPTL